MERKYYYSDGKEQFGPFSYNDLDNEKVTPETLFGYAGIRFWTKGKDLPELSGIFNLSPPPLNQQNLSPQKTALPTVSGQPIVIMPASDKSIFTGKNFVILLFVLGVMYMVFGGNEKSDNYNGSNEVASSFAGEYVGKMCKIVAPNTGIEPKYAGYDANYFDENDWSYNNGIYTINLHAYWKERPFVLSSEECQVDYTVRFEVTDEGKILDHQISPSNDCAKDHEITDILTDIGKGVLSEALKD